MSDELKYRLVPDGPARTKREWTAKQVEQDLAAALDIPQTAVVVDELDFAGDALHLTVFIAAPVVEA
jgi:hypothetical protein